METTPQGVPTSAIRAAKPSNPDARKHQVLAAKTPANALSIADAITVKHGDMFCVCLQDGRIPTGDDHGFGLYLHDCRFLSAYELTIGGERPDVLASAASAGHRAVIQLANPELKLHGKVIPGQTIGVLWSRLIRGDRNVLYDHFEFQNFGLTKLTVPVALWLDADFSDIFKIRGLLDERPGKLHPPEWHGNTLVFAYDGADKVKRSLRVHCQTAPTRREKRRMRFNLTLEPGEKVELVLSLHAVEDGEEQPDTPPALDLAATDHQMTEARKQWAAGHTQVRSSSPLLNRVIDQQIRDLHALRSRIEGDRFFAAGVPWYATLFGRDSLITALQMLAFDTDIAAETLRLLARFQGKKDDGWRDEAPGKILHELRRGELARLNEIPHTPYYGSVDSTPLWLVLLAEHARWSGALSIFHELRANVDAALAWIDRECGKHPRGFLAYTSNTDRGLINQGWRDSTEGVVNADGSLGEPPIALVEVQGYVYRAKLGVATLMARSGDAEGAARLRREAADLKQRFNEDFWLPEEGSYALAIQKDGRPAAVMTSNPGQALWTGIVAKDRAASVAQRLLAPDMFSGWGVRTLSADAVRYNPVGYHLGTVWPHDNALIMAGLRRYGLDDEAKRVFEAVVDAASHFDLYRLPEVFGGFPRDPYGEPVRYPVACHPQAWAAGTLPHMLTIMLGLEPDAANGAMVVNRPMLPVFVERLSFKGLRVANARVDLSFEHEAGKVKVETRLVGGTLDVRHITARNPFETDDT